MPTLTTPPPPSTSRVSAVNTASTTTTTPAPNALLGATFAFQRPRQLSRVPPTIATSPSTASDGALAAVSSSYSAAHSAYRSTHPGQTPSSSLTRGMGSIPVKELAALDTSKKPLLSQPQQNRPLRGVSPSQQAAVVAAARAHPQFAVSSNNSSKHEDQTRRSRAGVDTSGLQHGNLMRHNTFKRPAERKPGVGLPSTSRQANESHSPTDTTSIAPTTSLVNLFEQRSRDAQDLEQGKEAPRNSSIGEIDKTTFTKPIKDLQSDSTKPIISGITSMLQLEVAEPRGRLPAAQQRPTHKGQTGSNSKPRGGTHSFDKGSSLNSADFDPAKSLDAVQSASDRGKQVKPDVTSLPTIPAARMQSESRPREKSPVETSTATSPNIERGIPIKTSQRRRSSFGGSVAGGGSSLDAVSLSSSHPLKTIPAQFYHAYPRRMTPLTTGDDLANAIVASSLASSRAASPARLDVPPVPPHRRKANQHHSKFSFSRTPSPAKSSGMPHTLRKADSSSESEDSHHPYGKHRKRRLVRKHPNKHHEGDRKRWRDAVTEHERKRYEGVWAANKGLHYSLTHEEREFFRSAPVHQQTLQTKALVNDQVSNIVTREIWNRSRLPAAILEVIWDLVDNSSVGRLRKEEFVVGMWLIDQRLKGRKLPVKVSETVWASVRGIHGIKVKR